MLVLHGEHLLILFLKMGDKVMDTNVKAVFFLIQKLIKMLESSGNNSDPSRIINVGSIDGVGIPRAETYSYPASKAAIHQLTRVLANRLAKRNINVNAIAPGPFQSNMMAHSLKNMENKSKISPREELAFLKTWLGHPYFFAQKQGLHYRFNNPRGWWFSYSKKTYGVKELKSKLKCFLAR